MAICLALVCAGCEDSNGRISVSGLVTLGNVPVKQGSVRLIPTGGGPTSGGDIVDGKFAIPADKGVLAGTFRVQITARRPSGKMHVDEITGREFEVPEQYIPARYNKRSELEMDVTESGDNHFEYHLESE